MNAAHFTFGLVLGIVGAVGLGYVLMPTDGLEASTPLGTPIEADAAREAELAAIDPELALQLRRLREENERLRAQLAARQEVEGAGSPTEASADPTATGVLEAAALGKPGAHLDDLFAELELQLRSGILAQIHSKNPNGLLSLLLDNWMSSGHPADALALLRRFDVAEEFKGYSERIGEQLFEAGNRDLAREAFLLALKGGNRDWDVIGKLLQLDPAEALRQMESMEAGENDKSLAVQRALLAIRSGQRETGLAAFQALVAEGAVDNAAWRAFVQNSPEVAESQLRARLEAAASLGSDDRNFLHAQLAQSLIAQGRSSEAVDHLVAQLDAAPDDLSLINELGSANRDRAIAWLRAHVSGNPSPSAYYSLAHQLERAQQKGEAVSAYWQAFDLATGDRRGQTNYAERIVRLDPIGSETRVADFAGRSNNDELFGDLADALWRAGRQSEAYRYWRRAHDLDQNDSEWIRKLAAVDEGRAPL